MAGDTGPGPTCVHHVPAEASEPRTSTRLLQAMALSTRTLYLIKVQNTEEVLGILLGNLDSFLFSHAAVTRQAVTQKYLGISQLVEFSLL